MRHVSAVSSNAGHGFNPTEDFLFEHSAAQPLGEEATPLETARLVRSHLHVWTETLCVDRGSRLSADFRDLVAPVLALRFDYEGFSVAASDAVSDGASRDF